MKKLLLFILLVTSNSFAQKTITVSQALNIASKQSMLCERLAKEKVFKATYPNNFNIEKKLIISLIQFERNISILKSFNLPENILIKIEQTDYLWKGYRETLLSKDHDSAAKAITLNNSMYSLCEEIFTEILAYAKENNLYPYNNSITNFPEAYLASNKIKKLSQRFSLFYNAYYSHIIKYNSEDFNSIIIDLDNSITNINKLKDSNNEIKEKTLQIEEIWNSLKTSTKEIIENKFSSNKNFIKPEVIITQNNELLKDSDLLTRLYKELSDTN